MVADEAFVRAHVYAAVVCASVQANHFCPGDHGNGALLIPCALNSTSPAGSGRVRPRSMRAQEHANRAVLPPHYTFETRLSFNHGPV